MSLASAVTLNLQAGSREDILEFRQRCRKTCHESPPNRSTNKVTILGAPIHNALPRILTSELEGRHASNPRKDTASKLWDKRPSCVLYFGGARTEFDFCA